MWKYISLLVFLWSNTSFSQALSDEIFAHQVLTEINKYRTAHHLSPLILDSRISKIAANHSDRMMRQHGISHVNFKNRLQLICKIMSKCKGGAENVAYYPSNAKKLVAGWIASRGHLQNIKGNYNLTGIGIAYAKSGWAYYTQIFVRTN